MNKKLLLLVALLTIDGTNVLPWTTVKTTEDFFPTREPKEITALDIDKIAPPNPKLDSIVESILNYSTIEKLQLILPNTQIADKTQAQCLELVKERAENEVKAFADIQELIQSLTKMYTYFLQKKFKIAITEISNDPVDFQWVYDTVSNQNLYINRETRLLSVSKTLSDTAVLEMQGKRMVLFMLMGIAFIEQNKEAHVHPSVLNKFIHDCCNVFSPKLAIFYSNPDLMFILAQCERDHCKESIDRAIKLYSTDRHKDLKKLAQAIPKFFYYIEKQILTTMAEEREEALKTLKGIPSEVERNKKEALEAELEDIKKRLADQEGLKFSATVLATLKFIGAGIAREN